MTILHLAGVETDVDGKEIELLDFSWMLEYQMKAWSDWIVLFAR